MSCDDISKTELPRLFESGSVTLSDEQETPVIDAVGLFSSADVWFHVPEDWQENVAVRLYAKLASTRVLLAFVALRDTKGVVNVGNVSGIAVSSRGRPCTGLQVTVQRGPGSTLSGGTFAMQAWLGQEAPEVLGGAPFGEHSVSPVSNQTTVSLAAGKVTDSGAPEDRFTILRVNSGGNLLVEPEGGTFAVEGLGTAGTPTGGVVTVQGTGTGGRVLVEGTGGSGRVTVEGAGTGGRLTVEGPGTGGRLTVEGTGTGGRLTVEGTEPGGVLNVFATNDDLKVIGETTPGDSMTNPGECVDVAGFLHGFDGSVWKRARIQAVSGAEEISDASAPPGLATASFSYVYDKDNDQWRRPTCDSGGILFTRTIGSTSLADNVNVTGSVAQSWAVQAHRNQAGNWYLSRGGYNGIIAAAAIPAIANTLAAAAHNTTAPAPTNGDASALQVDGRGNLLIQQGKPASDARDTVSFAAFTAVNAGVVKNSAGNLLSLEAFPSSLAYVCLLNKTTTPVNGDTIVWRMRVPASGLYRIDRAMLSQAGIRFATGIAWAFSTTAGTVTLLTAAADHCVNATYV